MKYRPTLANRQKTESHLPGKYPAHKQRPDDEQARETAALLEVAKSVAALQELEPLLARILNRFGSLAAYRRAAIYLCENGQLTLQHCMPRASVFPALAQGQMRGLLETDRPMHIPVDPRRLSTPETALWRRIRGALEQAFPASGDWLWVPLLRGQQVTGGILLESLERGGFTPRQIELLAAAAALAGVSIENAQLYAQAQQLAAQQERQKLARDLHDSVSQALYGIALGAKTARALLEDHPREAVEPVEYVIALAGSALAEMRALIFELRPEALAEDGLAAAITTQAKAIEYRHQIEISLELGAEPSLPYPVKEALYRVVLEALHNIVRHAGAGQVTIRMESEAVELPSEAVELPFEAENLLSGAVELPSEAEALRLVICDDGRGFQAEADFPGHFGLRSMRQRVEKLGGTLIIHSAPGQGTTLEVRLPLRRE